MASSESVLGPVAVTGATGRQGGAVARALLAAGHEVRALTRRPESAAAAALTAYGAGVARCDLGDRDSVRRALDGVSQLYLTTTPYESGTEEEERQARIVIDEARAAGVQQVVYGSVASADRPTGVAHFESKGRVEAYLDASGIETTTVLRPTFFMDMFLDPAFRRALKSGSIRFVLEPGTRIAMIAVEDIAAFAVQAFARPEVFSGEAVDLAGDYPSMTELAAALSAALERDIAYVQVAEASLDPDVRPKVGTQRWLEDVGWHVEPSSAARYEVPLTTVRDWAEHHRDQLLTAVGAGVGDD